MVKAEQIGNFYSSKYLHQKNKISQKQIKDVN